MRCFGIAGHSGMGKTTLLERLVPELTGRGVRVSLIKHSHKDIEIDRPGKDSFRLRQAGCSEVLLLGRERWALMHELRGQPEPTLDYLLDRMQACDLVLVEGFKGGAFPKLEVWRASQGKAMLWPTWPGVIALASDAAPSASDMPPVDVAPVDFPPVDVAQLDLADVRQIADFVLTHAVQRAPGAGIAL